MRITNQGVAVLVALLGAICLLSYLKVDSAVSSLVTGALGIIALFTNSGGSNGGPPTPEVDPQILPPPLPKLEPTIVFPAGEYK